jgi:photosystem II stability/assembly factor-like uncharacterized protein
MGGLFRSRDAGATWLPLSAGSFASGAMALAVSPHDPNHLLLATDTGVSRSRNGGRDWQVEAPSLLTGPALGAVFDADGERAMVASTSGIFRRDAAGWREVDAPSGATPVRALVTGSRPGRIYLAGWTGLYRSDDWGRAWTNVGAQLGPHYVNALLVPHERPDEVYALAGGRVWGSLDGARTWQPRDEGLPASTIETIGLDASTPSLIWAVAGGRVFRGDDSGRRWRSVGAPIPERQAIARAIATLDGAILVATDRGVFRSADAGAQWELASDNLPAHLPAEMIVSDPANRVTVYAGFALRSADELRRSANQAKRTLERPDFVVIAGSYVLLALLIVAGYLVARHLARKHNRAELHRNA